MFVINLFKNNCEPNNKWLNECCFLIYTTRTYVSLTIE